MISISKQKGFSLVELMVASTIGLLITLSITALFITTRQGYSQNDNTAKMQEHARFALELISQDLRHAGFLGNISCSAGGAIDVTTLTGADPVPANDCGPLGSATAGLYNFSEARLLLNYGYQIGDTSAYYGSCISGPTPKSPGNILLIKRVAANPTQITPVDQRVNNTVYIAANDLTANLLTFPTPAPSSGVYWEYQPRLYYIDQGDVLYREIMDYSGAAPTLRAESLAEGIEAFHVEFGIDPDPNKKDQESTPNYYYVPTADNDPFAAQPAMNQAVSATLYILARTTEPDPDPTFLDDKTYTLGSMQFNGGNPPNDRFHRRVYTITVALNNLHNQRIQCSD